MSQRSAQWGVARPLLMSARAFVGGGVAALLGETTGNCLSHDRGSRRATGRHRPAPSTSSSATMTALPTQASQR